MSTELPLALVANILRGLGARVGPDRKMLMDFAQSVEISARRLREAGDLDGPRLQLRSTVPNYLLMILASQPGSYLSVRSLAHLLGVTEPALNIHVAQADHQLAQLGIEVGLEGDDDKGYRLSLAAANSFIQPLSDISLETLQITPDTKVAGHD
ncbi:hypothetical protein [Sphingomonas fennica]|nr:hypothetical protein [Sphingomonas fennica]